MKEGEKDDEGAVKNGQKTAWLGSDGVNNDAGTDTSRCVYVCICVCVCV